MNFLQRILCKRSGKEEKAGNSQRVMVCYEAAISFDTSFLVHFYDAANMPFLLERKGRYFQFKDYLPFHRSTVYFRVHVFNPMCLPEQVVTISISVRNEIAVEKTFAIARQYHFTDWHSVKASLV